MRKIFALFLLLPALIGHSQQVRLAVTGYRANYTFTDYSHRYSFDARFDEDGTLLGPVVIYQQVYRDNHADSVLVFRGNYVNGLFTDTLTWYYASGRLMRKAFVNSNLRPSVYWYEMGAMEIKGAPEGEVIEWYDQLVNGKQPVKSIRRYVNGKEDGLQEEFYASGAKKATWSSSNGKWNGPSVGWYEDGKPKEECTYIDGIRSGKRTLYYDNGRVMRVYANSAANETVTGYYANGKVSDVTYYRGFNRNGDYRKYDSLTGNVIDYRFYRNGRRDSICIEYYPSGKKKTVSHYAKGKRNGKCESWYENGKLKSRGNYSEGQKVGQWDYYDAKGLPNHATDYSNARAPYESDFDIDPNHQEVDEVAVEAKLFQFILPSINGTSVTKTIKPEDQLKFLKNYTTLEALASTDGTGKFTYHITTPMKPGEAEKLESWLNANYGTGNSARNDVYQPQPWILNVRIVIQKS